MIISSINIFFNIKDVIYLSIICIIFIQLISHHIDNSASDNVIIIFMFENTLFNISGNMFCTTLEKIEPVYPSSSRPFINCPYFNPPQSRYPQSGYFGQIGICCQRWEYTTSLDGDRRYVSQWRVLLLRLYLSSSWRHHHRFRFRSAKRRCAERTLQMRTTHK